MFNSYASWWRRRWHHEAPTADLADTGTAPPADARIGDRDQVWRALGHLPRRQRAVIVLRYFEDLTEAQTAEVLDCSIGNVKSQTSRALAAPRLDATLRVAEGAAQ